MPPLYHLNRATWPQRRDAIARHFRFWSPLHRVLATRPLTDFAWLSDDRSVQRTTFAGPAGPVHLTANFDGRERETPAGERFAARSITVGGAIELATRVFVARD